MSKKIMIVFGTRPEAIKLASIIKEFHNRGIKPILVNTGQHRDMIEEVLNLFKINVDFNLKIMETKQSLSKITRKILEKLDKIIKYCNPDIIITLGDTNTSFGAALCGFYNKIKLVHIEAGPRSYNKYDAFPEEINRVLLDHMADLNFCQTENDIIHLKAENIYNGVFVGNTSLDAINYFVTKPTTSNQILITMHRREGWGLPMKRACIAIKELAIHNPNHKFIITRHPNPIVYDTITTILGQYSNISLLDNLPFDEFIRLLAQSKFAMTDSGGVIQEAIFLKKPVIHLREKSEYEYLFDGTFLVSVGKDRNKILESAQKLIDMENPHSDNIGEFGDGTAGKKIVEYILGENK